MTRPAFETMRNASRWNDISSFVLREAPGVFRTPEEAEGFLLSDRFYTADDSSETSLYAARTPEGLALGLSCRDLEMSRVRCAPADIPLWKGDYADRLHGCAFLLHQPAFVTYVIGSSQIVTGVMTPLSQLRFGSGQCGTFATVCLAVVEPMTGEDGRRFEGAILNTPGHTMTVVRRHGDWGILDASVGNLFTVEDNSRPATVSELLQRPALAGRSSAHAPGYFRDPNLVFLDRHVGAEWPEGAPPA